MNKRSVHQALEGRIRFLKERGRGDDILLLMKRFSKAQDLVSEAHPIPGKGSLEDLISVMRSRQSLLLQMMEPFLTDRKTIVIMIPMSLN